MENKKTLSEIETINYFEDEKVIKTNIIPFDTLLGGGISPGGIIQLVGDSNIGKTTLALQVCKQYCLQEKKVLFIDTKAGVSSELINNIGLNEDINKKLFYVRVGTFKKLDEILNTYIETGEIDLIVIDSIASLINDGYLNFNKMIDIDNQNTNYDTRPLSLLIKKLSKLSIEYNMSILLINEYRNTIDKRIGTVKKIFGPKILHHETQTILVLSQCKDKKFSSKFDAFKKDNIGMPLYLEILKSNKQRSNIGIPFLLKYGKGCSLLCSYLYALLEIGVIKQKGTYYEFGAYKVNGLKTLYKDTQLTIDSLIKTHSTSVQEFYLKYINSGDDNN